MKPVHLEQNIEMELLDELRKIDSTKVYNIDEIIKRIDGYILELNINLSSEEFSLQHPSIFLIEILK